jgi:hypothetical protein
MSLQTTLVAGVFGLVAGAVLASDPPQPAIEESVDLVEINHYHDQAGKGVFRQLIFYDWSESSSRYDVRAWRLVKSDAQLPVRNPRNDLYVMAWHDGDLLRVVSTRQVIETWTQFDPELAERNFLPKDQRTDLARLPDWDANGSRR